MAKDNIQKIELRNFGLLIGLCFPLIIGWLIPLFTGHEFRIWTLILGIIFIILSVFFPKLLKYPYKYWMKLGYVLGWINGRLILTIIYVIIVVPLGLIMKLFKYDPLRNSFNNLKSYKEQNKSHKIDLKRIF